MLYSVQENRAVLSVVNHETEHTSPAAMTQRVEKDNR